LDKDYRGLIVAERNTKVRVPLTIHFGAGLTGGTMTQSTPVGDTVVKFTGLWQKETFHAQTGAVIKKPTRVKWDAESFQIIARADGTVSYLCTVEGDTYRAELHP